MSWAKIRVRAQPGYWRETGREAPGRNWGNLPSSIERSLPLWSVSSPAEEQPSQCQELKSETAQREREKEKKIKTGKKCRLKRRKEHQSERPACWK